MTATTKKAAPKKAARAKAAPAPKVELTPADPDFLLVKYNLTEQQLNQLAVDYDPKNIPEAHEKGDEGYLVIHERTMAITKVRTKIEAVRKDLTADAVAWQKKVNGEARRLTDAVKDLESPWREKKEELDTKEAREAEARAAAEAKRQAEIEGRVAGIKSLAEGLLGASADDISARIREINAVEITEEMFGDYVEAGTVMRDTIRSTLVAAHAEREAFEKQQSEMAEQQAKLDAQAAEQKKEQDRLDAEKAAQEAAEAAREAQRKADEQAEADRKEAQERADREAIERADREEAERKEQEAREKREAEERQARLPDDAKLRNLALELGAIKRPKLQTEGAKAVLVSVDTWLKSARDYIIENTQETEDGK